MKGGVKSKGKSQPSSTKSKKTTNVEKSERSMRTKKPANAKAGTIRLRIQALISQFIFQTRLVPITLVIFIYGWQTEVKIVVAFSFTCISTILLTFLYILYASTRMKERIPALVFIAGYAFTCVLGMVEVSLYGVTGLPQPRITLLVVCFAYVITSVLATLIFILWIFLMRNM